MTLVFCGVRLDDGVGLAERRPPVGGVALDVVEVVAVSGPELEAVLGGKLVVGLEGPFTFL